MQTSSKMPDYQGLGIQAEEEKNRLCAGFSGRDQEGVLALCGAIESGLKLVYAAVSRISGAEAGAVEETLETLKTNRDALRREYGVQDTAVFDAIEITLEARLKEISVSKGHCLQ